MQAGCGPPVQPKTRVSIAQMLSATIPAANKSATTGRASCAFDWVEPEFGFTQLVGVVNGVKGVDERGALPHLIGTIADAVRKDEQAIDSAAKVCRTLLSTKPPAGQAQSNAQLALPVVADLFASGIVAESICAIDTLVFGCTGGPQPACKP